MTSLIDVIFLLLLFFMLSSTFSHYSEIEITARSSQGHVAQTQAPIFLQLSPGRLTLNGVATSLATLENGRLGEAAAGTNVLLSMRGAVDSQRLTDTLVALSRFPHVSLTVLGN